MAGFAGGVANALEPGDAGGILLFAGAVAVLALLLALAARSPGQLRIEPEGFRYTALLAHGSYRFADIARFGVYLGVGGERVGFDFTPEYSGPRPRKFAEDARGGFAASLPSTYGRDARALVDLLERRRIAARHS